MRESLLAVVLAAGCSAKAPPAAVPEPKVKTEVTTRPDGTTVTTARIDD